jgi:long-subunit acyl-CoA synthetase (AMP-forming)
MNADEASLWGMFEHFVPLSVLRTLIIDISRVRYRHIEDNVPASIGKPIHGVQVKIGEKNALLVKGPNVMLGYWENPEATRAMFTEDGWLNTGDTARMDGEGRLYITGRLKEISS